jgi:hypothetical protein
MSENPIDLDMQNENAGPAGGEAGPVATIANRYTAESDRLLGFVLALSYEDIRFVTCDPWKRKCGGVPRNSFVLVKLGPNMVDPEDRVFCSRVILARVTESVPTPVESDIQNTVFQIHKLQPIVDPVTQKELQWSALKASVVGTYYDQQSDDGVALNVHFGNDVDTFFSPLAYEVYVPTNDDLTVLINSFVAEDQSFEIGRLRYTETPSPVSNVNVPVRVSIHDFIGRENGVRTALFSKTRFGKSNSIKVIADTILHADLLPGQLILDPSGEYTYFNPQDGTSLFMLHAQHGVRYSLTPNRPLPPEEMAAGLQPPLPLRVNFFDDIAVGHSLIADLFDSQFGSRPNYMVPILNWAAARNRDEAPSLASDPSGHWHFWRTLSLWYGCLCFADYEAPTGLPIRVNFPAPVKAALNSDTALSGLFTQQTDAVRSLLIPIQNLPGVLGGVARLWQAHRADANWFPVSNGNPYFNDVEDQMLKILRNDGSISGRTYLNPFRVYHDLGGSDIFRGIAAHLESRRTVFIDMARANETVRANLSERICRSVLDRMMQRFTDGTLGDLFIVIYFEEAHNLFRKDDADLNSIYNKLAKEGAKFHISMVYATQSMTTLSPDLLKNTENFFIGHLDDDREVREVTRKRAFRDIADDVERIQSKGYVRLLTASHRFALPVQIRKFEAPA